MAYIKTRRVYWRQTNKFHPHNGERECARRHGGRVWDEYRAADRKRRGLRGAT